MVNNQNPSGIDPYYTSGEFLANSSGWRDAQYKVGELRKILEKYRTEFGLNLKKVADIGCGTGDTTFQLADMLQSIGYAAEIAGYDVHPHVSEIKSTPNVSFHQSDFCQLEFEQPFDLAVLFDVIEHVPDPINFLRLVAQRTKLIGFHIPLDNSLFTAMRDLSRQKLEHPGHLIILDIPSSINLLTFAGLRVRDYIMSPSFQAPSSRIGRSQNLLYPVRFMLYKLNPYLLQRLLGGISLTVIAQTPLGFANKIVP